MNIKKALKTILPKWLIDKYRKIKTEDERVEEFYISPRNADLILREIRKHISENDYVYASGYVAIRNCINGWVNDENRKLYANIVDVCKKSEQKDNDAFRWFMEHHFSPEEKIRALRGDADFYNDCFLVVVCGGTEDDYDKMLKDIDGKISIIGFADWDFSKNPKAYQYLMKCVTESESVLLHHNSTDEAAMKNNQGPFLSRFILMRVNIII